MSLEYLMPLTSYTISLIFVGPAFGPETFTSNFEIEVVCGISSSITTLIHKYSMDSNNNSFSFDPFVCSIDACCIDMYYSFSPASDFLSPFSIDPDSGRIFSIVDVSTPILLQIQVQA